MKSLLKWSVMALVSLTCQSAFAASGTWTGNTDANWLSTGNWTGASAPTSADTATFSNTILNGNGTTTPLVIDSGRAVSNLIFTSSLASAYVIGTTSGNALTLSSSGSILMTSDVINSQTINAPLTLNTPASKTYSFLNNAALSNATLNFGGTITGSNNSNTTLTLGGSNSGWNTMSGSIADGSSALGLVKSGTGTWVLSGANSYTGTTTLRSGTLVLDYTSNSSSKLGNNSALSLGGVNLQLKGGSGTQAVASTNINGGGQAYITQNGGSTVLSMGALSAGFTSGTGAISSVNFQTGVATTTTLKTAGNNGAANIFGGWATFGSTGNAYWATSTDGNVIAYTGETALPASGGSQINYVVNDSASTSVSTVYALRITTDASAGDTPTLTLLGKMTLGANGGILNSASSTSTYRITGGSIAIGSSGTSIQQYGAGALQIESQILGSNGIYFQKSGPGMLILTGNNAWKQTFAINEGTVSVASDANLGGNSGTVTVLSASTTGTSVTLASAPPATLVIGSSFLGSTVTAISGTTITLAANANQNISSNTDVAYAVAAGLILNGGTLQATGTFALAETGASTLNRSIAVGANGGTIEVTSGNTVTASGVVSDLTGTGATAAVGTLTKSGSGTLVLSGTNTYTGGTSITQGKLLVSNTSGSATGTGQVDLGTATLSGTGTVSGLVTTHGANSLIAAGETIGTLSLTGGLNATNGASFLFELGTTSDLITLGSGVFTGSSAAHGLLFSFLDGGGLTAGTAYTLMTFGSSSGLDYSDLLAQTLPSGYVLDTSFGTGGFLITGTSLQVQFSAVPEPRLSMLIILSGMLLLVRRRYSEHSIQG